MAFNDEHNEPIPISETPDSENEAGSLNLRPVVVGIGASAGGLAALRTLLRTIPEKSGIAYVVVVHLSPEHNSHLAELLQPHVQIPVQQVTGAIPLEPDRVYVIPPGKNLSAIDSHLRLSELEQSRRERAPVDHFFRTLAQTHDGSSVGIILTGTGSDGTLGIQEIKGKCGLTIVQDPSEAEYDGMPQSALSTGIIDLILPLEQMIDHVLRFVRTQPRLELNDESDNDPRPLLHKIFMLIRSQLGNDFTRYKQSTIMRRIRRRMQIAQIEELSEYVNLLKANPEEISALANDFLITVTSFFRDKNIYEEIERKIIPQLFANKQPNESVRIWSVGCATGEEAYSLAMLLLEYAEQNQFCSQIQIFASDLHAHSLKKARDGLYSGDIETDVSSERLGRFFYKENGSYRIKSEVRDLVVFSPHNLLADPPFTKMDMIVCRNVMIYLQRNLQPDIIDLFHYALMPHGFLILGTAEGISQSDLFSTENKASGIYVKRNVPCPEPRLPVFPFRLTSNIGQIPRENLPEPFSYGVLHHKMVERYAQPSILINSENKVVHLSRNAGRYLTYPGGTPTTSIFKLIHEDLQAELGVLLHMVAERKIPCASRPVRLQLNGDQREVIMQARPGADDDEDAFMLIIFDERDLPQVSEADEESNHESSAAIREIEMELELTKRRLQVAVDEYETSQEEMRATNEELQSANEELRSTLEELETSKEELQSINEELQTANQENRHKVAELGQLSDDLQHLMSATHIATLFLDRKLRILRFTPQIGELFNLRSVDRGRPLSDLTHRLSYDELMDDAARVLEQLIPSEREVKDDSGHWYLARMRPYRTADDYIDGLVLTFVDITARIVSEIALRESEERYRALFESMDEGFCVIEKLPETDGDDDFKIVVANPAFLKLTGLPNNSSQTLKQVAPHQLPFWKDIYHRPNTNTSPSRFECRNDVFNRWLEIYSFRLPKVYGPHLAVLFKDINEQKIIEEALRVSAQRDGFRVALTDAIRNCHDPLDIQAVSCRMLSDYLDVDSVIYGEYQTDQNILHEHGHVQPRFRVPDGFRLWEQNEKLTDAFLAGRILSAEDTLNVPILNDEQKNHCRSIRLRAYVTVPLADGDKIASVLSILHSEPRQWSDAEIAFIKEVAERIRDAIARTRAEQALRQRELSLLEIDQHKNEFLAVLSHELRNPLAPILNALYVIENSERSGEKANAALTIMKRQTGLMSRLIDDLLDTTRIAQGKLQLRNKHVELNQLIDRTIGDYISIFQRAEVDLNFTPAPSDVWVYGDENRLSQTIGNLLQNCAKFTPAHGTTQVNLYVEDEQAVISVVDSGVGIAEELIEQLFEPFIQGESTIDRSKGGLGLGLALSKRLVELHGGTITARSAGVNQGAEFEIRLPKTDVPASSEQLKATDRTSRLRKILVIEDNVDSANTMRDVLRLHNHDVEVAYDGSSGMELASQFKPDIVICDIGLPGVDGYEVARLFRSKKEIKETVLVALSGYAMAGDLARAKKAGFDYHLAKPADLEKLQEILDDCK